MQREPVSPQEDEAISRRTALGIVGGGVAAAGVVTTVVVRGAQAQTRSTSGGPTAGGSAVARLVISQRAWDAAKIGDTLAPLMRMVEAQHGCTEPHTLILLPRAEPPGRDAPREDRFVSQIAALAKDHGLWIAGAAPVRDAQGIANVGFIVSPAGTLALRIGKATPDVFDGFTDASATLAAPVTFAVADTPFGKFGLLVGEDAQMPGLVRGAMLAGAEVLLNPSSGAGPGTQDALAEAPSAMAYENWNMVAVATPLTRRQGDVVTSQAGRSGLFDWRGQIVRAGAGEEWLSVRLDVEPLRLARAKVSADIYDNFPTWLRDDLFGAIFAHQASQRPAAPSPRDRAGWRAEGEKRVARQNARKTPADKLENYYLAYIVQPATMASLPVENRRAALVGNIDTALGTIGRLAMAPNARIALFPEFCFTGAGYRSVPDLLTVACTLPGPEVAKLQQWARDNTIYAAAQFMEADPKFPNRAFNTAVLIDDKGDIILMHRKLQCVDIMGALPDTTPGSVYDRYVQEYGIEAMYDIADTPLGKIGVTICFEVNLPEIMRAMTLAGAEIILHLTAEGYGSERPLWHAERRKRAYENQAYLLCSNKGYDLTKKEPWVPYGESQFIDFRGRERDRINHNGPGVLVAPVDMAALRAARADLRFNLSIWDEPAAYADAYRQKKGVPNNLWSGDPLTNPHIRTTTLEATRDRYYERGVYMRPRGLSNRTQG
jgi:predicted amidohydrolase